MVPHGVARFGPTYAADEDYVVSFVPLGFVRLCSRMVLNGRQLEELGIQVSAKYTYVIIARSILYHVFW